MNEIAIRAENLGKQYRIGGPQARYKTIRESLVEAAQAPFRGMGKLLRGQGLGGANADETIWALKDVSFDVKQGEVVGIIGRNGAGKTTLLKILSRITKPTEGHAEIHGRVGSLLEVGTGFHPELSGRENIYLNGAILGMKKREIDRKFDEIVAFAEIEKFMDTPVKHYSSGMYVRLAFAVAAHLESEILLVDEVLAVGDAEFQKKCLGKMSDVAKGGRTVLFVSHNMAAVQQLCQHGIVLSHGRVDFAGSAHDAMAHYMRNMQRISSQDLASRRDRQGSQWLKFTRVAICDAEGNELHQVLSGQIALIRLYYSSQKSLRAAEVNIAFNVRSDQGYLLTNLNTIDVGEERLDICPSGYFQCTWPTFNLKSGMYDCALFCAVNGEIVDWMQSAFTIHVESGDFFNTGKLIGREQGDILVPHSWSSHSGSGAMSC
jgi:lipopolysaccharide transport system ATP-binding protein